MKSRIQHSVSNKYKRILYIKTELNQLVNSTLWKNTNTKRVTLAANVVSESYINKEGSKSKQRLFCSMTNNAKIVSKKYKLGRYAFAYLCNNGKLGGFFKRGW